MYIKPAEQQTSHMPKRPTQIRTNYQAYICHWKSALNPNINLSYLISMAMDSCSEGLICDDWMTKSPAPKAVLQLWASDLNSFPLLSYPVAWNYKMLVYW